MPITEDTAIKAWVILTDAMNEYAIANDLCSDYDDFVAQVNYKLPWGIKIPERRKTYEVTFTVVLSEEASQTLESVIDNWTEDECDSTVENYEINEVN